MAGYSTKSEQDEAAAVRAVAALSEEIAAVAQVHGGRVFNTAGDGFMLEFPTVTGALEAADALSKNPIVPIRTGVHLGEVSVRKGGDLLGHGVNVAARLQALAPTGGVMVSDDVRRAVRGVYAQRLSPRGRAKLDNIKETAQVFQLIPPDSKAKRRLPIRRLAAAAVLMVAVAAAWFLAPRLAPKPKDIRAAVQSFTTVGPNAPPASFGEGLADRIASALQDRQVPTVSRNLVARGDLSAVRLTIGGEVERDGPDLRVRVHIDDRRAGLILWSTSFQRPAQEADAIQDEVAAKVADVVGTTRQRLGSAAGDLSPAALAAYMKAMDVVRLGGDHGEEVREAFRQVVLLAPKVSRAHSAYAFSTLNTLRNGASAMDGPRRKEALDEANTALALDPHNGEAYMSLYFLAPSNDIAQQESWLLKGLAADPDYGSLYNYEAGVLASVGRSAEAFALYNRSLALDPLSPPKTSSVIYALASVGRYADALALSQKAQRLWPAFATFRNASLSISAIYSPPDQALAQLEAYQKGDQPIDQRVYAPLRDLIRAREGQMPKAVAAKTLRAAAEGPGGIRTGTRVSGLALLGDLDGAFVVLDPIPPNAIFNMDLFMPATAPLRADPRFMPLAARLGLVRYWQTTGHWPDFCIAPSAPYDCRKTAQATQQAAKAHP